MSDFAKDHPNTPLNTFIEEDIPVQKIKFDPETKKITRVVEMEKQQTMYVEAPLKKIRCKPGTHVFRVLDKNKYIFICKNCRYKTRVHPAYFSFDEKTGSLASKTTGEHV